MRVKWPWRAPVAIAIVLPTAVALLTSTDARAQSPNLERWTRARTPHFTVITDGDAKDAQRLARQHERLRLVFVRLWPTARIDAKQVVIVAPFGRSGLAQLLPPTWADDKATHPAGVMVAGVDRMYVGVQAGRDHPARDLVAVHEYVHLLVETNVPAAPLWLNEGLAEFFAAGRLEESPAIFGLPHTGHLQVLRAREWLPLDVVLGATRGSPIVRERGSSAVFYAQAWLLVHYLKHAEAGRYTAQLTAFTAKVAQGVPLGRAAIEAFGDLRQLTRRLQAYARRERFFDARLPIEETAGPGSASIERWRPGRRRSRWATSSPTCSISISPRVCSGRPPTSRPTSSRCPNARRCWPSSSSNPPKPCAPPSEPCETQPLGRLRISSALWRCWLQATARLRARHERLKSLCGVP